MSTPLDAQLLRAAFREMHGTRLHGFALLVTAGDRRLAARLSGAALHDGARRVDELRHPERAAAWLRARVLRSLRRHLLLHRPARLAEVQRLAALHAMEVDAVLLRALSALSLTERAALVAAAIERLTEADVQTVLSRGPAAAARTTSSARRHYLAAHRAATSGTEHGRAGPLRERVLLVAARAMARATTLP